MAIDLKTLSSTPRHKIRVEGGLISEQGVRTLKAKIKNEFWMIVSPEFLDLSVWRTNRGTLPKRFSAAVERNCRVLDKEGFHSYQKHLEKVGIPDEFLRDLGNLAQQFMHKESRTYHFDIVPPPFDWEDGKYGKTSSCWWTRNDKHYLIAFEQTKGAYCIRFYSDDSFHPDSGCGRIWAYERPGDGVVLLFNGYYNDEGATATLARVLAEYLGVYCRQIHTRSPALYINSSNTFLLGRREEVLRVKEPCQIPAE